MFLEALTHVLTLDLFWFIDLIMNNLFWVFAFIAVMYFFTDGKRTILGVILIIFDMWLFVDLEIVASAVIFSGGFLTVYYISKLAFLTIVENSKKFKKHIIVASTLQGWVMIFIYNIFLQ